MNFMQMVSHLRLSPRDVSLLTAISRYQVPQDPEIQKTLADLSPYATMVAETILGTKIHEDQIVAELAKHFKTWVNNH